MATYLAPFAVCALLAVLYQTKLLRLDRTFYALAVLALGLFAGLRFEVGQDWPAYEAFFSDLDLSSNPFDLYFDEHFERPQFEIGYYLLNYAVKWLGGTYSVVLLAASLFCAYAVYRLTSRFPINRFYVLTIYVGYSFLILHFAQVRQSIAIAFFLLGVDYYLRHERKLGAVLIMLIGPLFQFSALAYVLLFLIVLAWQRPWSVSLYFKAAAAVALIPLAYAVSYLDFYDVVGWIAATASAEERIAVYREAQEATGSTLLAYAGYLMLLIWYFSRYAKRTMQPFIVHYAMVALALTVALVFIFPGSYVMYSRGYVIACIFQAIAAALIFAAHKGWLHRAMFVGTIAAGAVYYVRILSLNEDVYVPYHAALALAGL
jgi:hypothetical protein